jgi:hypothetical protein
VPVKVEEPDNSRAKPSSGQVESGCGHAHRVCQVPHRLASGDRNRRRPPGLHTQLRCFNNCSTALTLRPKQVAELGGYTNSWVVCPHISGRDCSAIAADWGSYIC